MNTKTIIVVLVVVALIVLAIILWPNFSSAPENELDGGATAAADSPSASLGGQVYGAVSPNTAQAVPETNPFKADVNPYKDAYKNPFTQ